MLHSVARVLTATGVHVLVRGVDGRGDHLRELVVGHGRGVETADDCVVVVLVGFDRDLQLLFLVLHWR